MVRPDAAIMAKHAVAAVSGVAVSPAKRGAKRVKLSDYIADFLARQGIRHVFAVSGGASVHMIDSIAKHPDIDYICPQHEQAGAMAADAYSRVTGNLGAAIATSGPGATNMVTGMCCAYYDSVPVIFLTGQVSTFRFRGNTGVRQIGFQETEIVDMVRSVTKYVVRVDDPKKIRYELEKACYIAREGRPGPVVVDVPDNLQRTEIVPSELEAYIPETTVVARTGALSKQVEDCLPLLREAKRPVIVLGWGVRLAKAERVALNVIERLGFPVVPTWAMMDFLPYKHPLMVGGFGSHGTRYGNFTVQNADLVLVVGSRLDSRASSPITTFARAAKKIVVDVDVNELGKFKVFGMDVDVPVHADANDFLTALRKGMGDWKKRDLSDWLKQIERWKERFPICPPAYHKEKAVNPYVFMKELSKQAAEGATIFVDTGCALAWMMQAFEVKRGQRLFHDFNNTAMGYALPASVGACLALKGKPIICVTGDGSLQMNIQEMATIARHNLPIKVFLINNHGYSMIQQTQDQWLDSKYEASSVAGGLASPDFVRVAKAYDFKAWTLSRNKGQAEVIRKVLRTQGPTFCNVEVRPEHRVIPQVKYGRPIEDPEPLLERDVFMENMIIEPHESSIAKDGQRTSRA
jgi:acetolactate synthase-1/2/3 large subunit